ncbi:CDP-alcohol phosphatidyltransferase family protein [Vibrio sp. SCSIO 43132]|uniref:CDP-alcohol phosphatidyltransferase family protein n=1 Tax=Vibrio sp. SCSIO 43132 TaxID=2779363 RepID=UPI001CA8E906|nr:CDP-alcohol phosphatidyltransferase family protein [Vibrio sp. SCSIO 43132]UAB70273.1 CDP-alcohol phosphatidyltransferase family protein [Vibrio sp. SCSIO 43132]
MMITSYKQFFSATFKAPIHLSARLTLKCGFNANTVTLLALLLAIAASAMLMVTENFLWFAYAVAGIGYLDLLDGAVARASNTCSRFGAYFDAMCDRIVDAVTVFAIAWVSGLWPLCFAYVIGSLLVSYAKSRAAMEVSVSNTSWPDLMERTERFILFTAILLAYGLFPDFLIAGYSILVWGLVVSCVLIYLTLVQRWHRAWRLLQ